MQVAILCDVYRRSDICSDHFDHFFDHFHDAVVDLEEAAVEHERRSGHDLVLLVHADLIHT